MAARASSSAYVVNFGSGNTPGNVSQYDVGAGGALSPNATPTVTAGLGPFAIAISPNGKSAYVADVGLNGPFEISQYTVGPGGALSPMTPATAPGGLGPAGVAVSPDGKSVYVTNNDSSGPGGVSQYTVGPGGALSPMTPATVDSGATPVGIAVSPDGTSVYVANDGANGPGAISQYTVGPDGALSPKTPATVAGGSGPFEIVIAPDGKSVYAVNFSSPGAGGVSQFTVGAGGALTPMAPATVASGPFPLGIAVSPNGKNAYVANDVQSGVAGVSQYTIGPGGALTPMTPAAVDAGPEPEGIAVSPDGKSVYVTNSDTNGAGGVSQYDVGPDGGLSPKTTATVAAGNDPSAVVVLPDQGPVAAFSAAGAPAGTPTSFDASASADSDGAVASYAWSFGDGTTQTTTSPLVSHVYAEPGSYTATLTVTDDAGCSSAFVFTGETAYCNGGPQAQTTRQLTIPLPGVPFVQITSPTEGARYARGRTVLAGYACREGAGGPGISSCTGPVANGQPIDTTAVGQHTFTVTATSKDGQTSTGTVTYTVLAPSNHFKVSHITIHRNGTITCHVKVPGPGRIDVLETAWDDNLAHAAIELQPAPRRFVFARLHKTARRATTLRLRVTPNKRGRRLVHHHRYRVTLRLWVSYTPTGGRPRSKGFYGLQVPGAAVSGLSSSLYIR
ncbi:MAG: beta-propeller fold lactonase family protein [Solirubrobacteraceae bacterium]